MELIESSASVETIDERNSSFETESNVDNESTNVLRKHRIRKRKRELYRKIREQIYYYFSDSNLRHDKFMRKLTGVDSNQTTNDFDLNDSANVVLEEEPGTKPIQLNVFLKFNKIIELTTDEQDLFNAFKYDVNDSLNNNQLVFDENGRKLYRREPYYLNNEANDRTIYIEGFCTDSKDIFADIRNLFEKFGNILSIRTPRYRQSKQLMGFAFVEFSEANSVEKACKYFETPNRENNQTENVSQITPTAENDNAKSDSKYSDDTNNSNCDVVQQSKNNEKLIQLRVLSKSQWNQLKNRYLKLQKKASTIYRKQQAQYRHDCEQIRQSFQLKLKPNENKANKRKLDSIPETVTNSIKNLSNHIVEIEFHIHNPELSSDIIRKTLRTLFEQNNVNEQFPNIKDIAYIDVPNGNMKFFDDGSFIQTCYIRTHTLNTATLLTHSSNYLIEHLPIKGFCVNRIMILNETQVTQYWQMINCAKKNKNKRVKY